MGKSISSRKYESLEMSLKRLYRSLAIILGNTSRVNIVWKDKGLQVDGSK